MFHSKSKKEQLQDRSASLADTAATVADQLRERVAPAIGQAAGSAKEWGQPRVEAARLWAKPRVEHGIEVAAPKLESAVSGLAPKVDIARDKIVDELLPRVTEAITAWAAASAAAKDEVVSRGSGAAAVVRGDAVAKPKRNKRGRVLMTLGVLGAAGAAVTSFLKKSAPKDDPWATPLTDPYIAPSSGRHSGLDSPDASQTTSKPEKAASGDPKPAKVEPAKVEPVDEASVPDPLAPADEADDATGDSTDEGKAKDKG
ncbi:MAG: hypothetical protein HHJ11_08920 [Phycicoccus sp.]|nr:hypothetical protein [Phycicoccus sp.]NMM35874.1 hypothetical protein [Phycicoccus sp.]